MVSILGRPLAALRRHRERRSRGQSLVELGLILPVFMLFFAAVLDLGRIAAAEVAVTNAAREGAFQAAITPSDFDATQPCPADGKTNVIYCRVRLESGGTVTIDPSDVSVLCNPSDCSTGIGHIVTVRVTGHFRLLTPLMAVFFGGNQNVDFGRSSTVNRTTLPEVGTTTTAPSASPSPSPSASGSDDPSASPSPSPPTCQLPSAGFSFTVTGGGPNNDRAPVTLNVTDTSTSINCGITSWLWNWGDGTTSLSQVPGPHSYIAKNPDRSGYYSISLKVTNAAGANTSGAVQIPVK